jgi:alpha-N-arabinofuranosidase
MIIRHLVLSLTAGLLISSTCLFAQNSFTIKQDAEIMEYNPMIFGAFLEHFDNQVYGGVFSPGSPLSDEDGFRKDVIEAVKELKVPIVRWPGGCFVSAYHWKDAVGPDRQSVWDKAWQVEDTNTFGTDEFVKWCRKVGCEPFICTNAGTGTMEEMSDWVEYCNQTVGKFARQRAANGHPEPFNVKYWSIGNENWGMHELGEKSSAEWGPLVTESAKLMLSADKNIKLFAAALPSHDWTYPLLKKAGYLLDYVSIHGYWVWHDPSKTFLDCMMSTDDPEGSISTTIDILKEAGFDGKIKIAFDEWNLRGWYHPGIGDLKRGYDYAARRENDIASTYTMADAVFSACFLNTCLRHSDVVDIACISPITNTRGPIFVHPEGIVRRTTFYTMKMYANDLLPYVVPVDAKVGTISLQDDSTKVLDMILTTDKTGKKYVCAVANKDPEKDIALSIDFKGMGIKAPKKVSAKVLSGRSADDFNDIGDEHVQPFGATLPVKDGTVSIPAHSVTFLFIE